VVNWKDYIDQKFQPADEFEINRQQDSPSLDIKHIRTGNIVSFINPKSDWKTVADIQYWNHKTKGWSGEFGETEFDEENKNYVDDFLIPVFETGWSSKDIYLFGKFYKSEVFDRPNLKGRKFGYWGDGFGCILLILFPLFIAIELLIMTPLLGKAEIIEIEPIK
jgi:hypothetical protein